MGEVFAERTIPAMVSSRIRTIREITNNIVFPRISNSAQHLPNREILRTSN
jgi:hypothetical protein